MLIEKQLTADLLKKIRKKNNFTQNEMAKYLEVTPRTYQRYESGDSELSSSLLLKVFKIYDDDAYLSLISNITTAGKMAASDEHIEVAQGFTEGSLKVKVLQKSHLPEQMIRKNKYNFVTKDEFKSDDVLEGYIDWSVDRKTLFFSDEIYDIYQIEKAEYIDANMVKKYMFEEDINAFDQATAQLISNDKPYDNIHRIRYSKNAYYLVHQHCMKLVINKENIIIVNLKAKLMRY